MLNVSNQTSSHYFWSDKDDRNCNAVSLWQCHTLHWAAQLCLVSYYLLNLLFFHFFFNCFWHLCISFWHWLSDICWRVLVAEMQINCGPRSHSGLSSEHITLNYFMLHYITLNFILLHYTLLHNIELCTKVTFRTVVRAHYIELLRTLLWITLH